MTTTILTQARTFSRIVRALGPYVAKPTANTPVLTCIRFEVAQGVLTACTTDRYRLGVYRGEDTLEQQDGAVLVPAVAVAQLAKAVKKGGGFVALTNEDVGGDVAWSAVSDEPAGSVSGRVDRPGNYPPVLGLLDGAVGDCRRAREGGSPSTATFSPEHLADLSRTAREMRLRASAEVAVTLHATSRVGKPTVVTFGPGVEHEDVVVMLIARKEFPDIPKRFC